MLEDDLASGNLAHAYLLAGPNSVGKYTVAKKMAGILQCDKDFCHECPSCLQVSKGGHMDTIELKDDGGSIKIGEVRKIVERLSMTGQSNYKILLIQSLERMTREAANSFLKTLEEPSPRTVFIMTTNSMRDLLPTIVSRVRILKFASMSSAYLKDKLKTLYPDGDEETMEKVSLFSMGKTGKAVHLMENPASLASYVETYHKVQNFLHGKSVVSRFSYVGDLLEEDGNVDVFFSILTGVLRSKVLSGDLQTDKYLKTLSKIEEAGILLKKNVNSRLLLENLMLAI